MKFHKSKFAVYCVLVFLWLAFCCTSCPEEGSKYWTFFCAYRPADVDSLELKIVYMSGDFVKEETEYSDRGHEAVCVECYGSCDDMFSSNDDNKIMVEISFKCEEKMVTLPTYVVDSSTIRWGQDNINFNFVELDERKIHGTYMVEAFLPPEDTSCGKFVNYAVLRLP